MTPRDEETRLLGAFAPWTARSPAAAFPKPALLAHTLRQSRLSPPRSRAAVTKRQEPAAVQGAARGRGPIPLHQRSALCGFCRCGALFCGWAEPEADKSVRAPLGSLRPICEICEICGPSGFLVADRTSWQSGGGPPQSRALRAVGGGPLSSVSSVSSVRNPLRERWSDCGAHGFAGSLSPPTAQHPALLPTFRAFRIFRGPCRYCVRRGWVARACRARISPAWKREPATRVRSACWRARSRASGRLAAV